jgi:hypothetical protein
MGMALQNTKQNTGGQIIIRPVVLLSHSLIIHYMSRTAASACMYSAYHLTFLQFHLVLRQFLNLAAK